MKNSDKEDIFNYAIERGFNGDLAVCQRVTKKQIDELSRLHSLAEKTKSTDPENTPRRERQFLVGKLEVIENFMQDSWNFKRDSSRHTHWLYMKGCTCPKLDNNDPLVNKGCRIINKGCPWHGTED